MRRETKTFGQAMRAELRNEFGPGAISGATRLALILVGLVLVATFGFGTLDLASSISEVAAR